MSAKNGGEGLLAKIFVGVATTVLGTLILYKLGVKDSKPETPPKAPDSVQALNPVDPPKVADKPKPPESTRARNPSDPSNAPNTPAPSAFAAQASLPQNSCPAVQGMFWMQYPNSWYGPYGNGDAIFFNGAGGFSVYNAQMLNHFGKPGAVGSYPDPYRQLPRNVWIPLLQSRFSVCIDGLGNVFGWAQP